MCHFLSHEVFTCRTHVPSSLNWQLVTHACSQISTTVATAYDSLGELGLLHALNEPEATGIFTNADLLPMLAKVMPKANTVRLVVYDGEASAQDLERLRSARSGFKLLSLQELRDAGKGKPDPNRIPSGDDVACIMYTSGTTGPPKGVVLTHSNLIAAGTFTYRLRVFPAHLARSGWRVRPVRLRAPQD